MRILGIDLGRKRSQLNHQLGMQGVGAVDIVLDPVEGQDDGTLGIASGQFLFVMLDLAGRHLDVGNGEELP